MGNITRRKFLKTGAQGVALASVPFLFRINPLAALATPNPDAMTLRDYFDHFGVTETAAKEVMEAALSKGGDFCDLYFQHTVSTYIGLEDNVVNRAYTNVDLGVGIRVVKGDQTGFSFTEEISPKAMKLAAKTAANIASGPGGSAPGSFNPYDPPNYYPIETDWETVGVESKMPILRTMNDMIFGLDKRIIKSRSGFGDDTSYILYLNSDGIITYDYQPSSSLFISCTAEQDGQVESSYADYAGRYGMEFFTPEKVERLVKKSIDRTVVLFDAVKPDAGEMPVVLGAGSSGILLHEAIGHGMEADFNRKNTSIFADKIDKPVAEKFVSIVDDGTNKNMRGSINIDDEGQPTEKTYLVRDGILRSYMHDLISAKYYKVKPTGSGRRESFRYMPIPRMRNTYMLDGPHTRDEIIASVKKGLYAEHFANGQVQIGAGDFSFYVKNGRLIEDGKLTKPVKDINIIGNGPQVLSKVTMVANDLTFAEGGWTCGKAGQGVPVSMGLPTVKVSAITVGGVNS